MWDDHLSVRQHAQASIDQANAIIEKNCVENVECSVVGSPEVTEFVSVTVVSVGCADQAALHSNEGQGGCNEKYPCSFCKVHQSKLCSTELEEVVNWPARKRDENVLLAHAGLGKCPGCKMEIVAVVTDKETQRPVAEPGSKPPKSPFEYKKMTHSVVHFNKSRDRNRF